MKILRIMLIMMVALIVLLIIAATALVYFFNPNDYKDEITQFVKTKKQRTLKLDGDLKLTLFPKLGIDIGKATLSEHNSDALFASIDGAHVSLALMPLLNKQMRIDKIQIDGLNANIVRDESGHGNLDDLLEKNAAADTGSTSGKNGNVQFDLAGLVISNSSITLNDASLPLVATFKNINADIGHIADKNTAPTNIKFSADLNASKPKITANIAIDSMLLFDLDAGKFSFDKLNIAIAGSGFGVKDSKLAANANALVDTRQQQVDINNLSLTTSGVAAVKLDTAKLSYTAGKIIAEAIKLSVDGGADKSSIHLATPTLRFADNKIRSDKINGTVTMPAANKTVQFDAALEADIKKETAAVNVNATVDDSHIKGNVSVAHFSKPVIQFDLDADQFNLDHYMTPAPKGDAAASNPNAAAASARAIDLTVLNFFSTGVSATGKLHLGKLQAQNMKFQDISMGINAADSKVELAPISVNLYQGSLLGSITVSSKNDIVAKQNLSNVAINPLLIDALNRDILEGRGGVILNIKTSGNNIDAFKRNLSGSASLNLRDGAVKGINLAQKFRELKSMLGKTDATESANKSEKTDFSELTASFNIANGVAKNDDLALKSPFLRIGGSGEIDIAKQQINYTVKSTVVNTATGQDGKDLAQLKDITIPVLLSGPFNQLSYRIQWSAIASKVLQQKLNDKINEQLFGKSETKPGETEPARDKKPEQILKEKLQDKLKGLFGR